MKLVNGLSNLEGPQIYDGTVLSFRNICFFPVQVCNIFSTEDTGMYSTWFSTWGAFLALLWFYQGKLFLILSRIYWHHHLFSFIFFISLLPYYFVLRKTNAQKTSWALFLMHLALFMGTRSVWSCSKRLASLTLNVAGLVRMVCCVSQSITCSQQQWSFVLGWPLAFPLSKVRTLVTDTGVWKL